MYDLATPLQSPVNVFIDGREVHVNQPTIGMAVVAAASRVLSLEERPHYRLDVTDVDAQTIIVEMLCIPRD